MRKISQRDFNRILLRICDQRTTYGRQDWTLDNVLWGQCAVVTLLAQDVFGGDIVRASLAKTKFAQCRWHFWNKLLSGKEKDFTRKQFGKSYPKLNGELRSRSKILSSRSTVRRYELLRKRYERETKGDRNG